MGESPKGFPTGRCGLGEVSCVGGWDHALTLILPHSRPGAGESAARCARSGSWGTYRERWGGEMKRTSDTRVARRRESVLSREQHVSPLAALSKTAFSYSSIEILASQNSSQVTHVAATFSPFLSLSHLPFCRELMYR